MSLYYTVVMHFDCDEQEPATWEAVTQVRELIEQHLSRVCDLIHIPGSGCSETIIKWACNYGVTGEFLDAVRAMAWPEPWSVVSIVQWAEGCGPEVVLVLPSEEE